MNEHGVAAAAEDAGSRTLRPAEFDRLRTAVDAARPTGEVLTVTGAPGSGRTTLVTQAAEHFSAAGGRVLRAEGSRSEIDLPFSGLHQLLWPVRRAVDALPARQRAALHTAFGHGERGEPPEPMLVGTGVLTLLCELAAERPLLLVVDDAQWTDVASLDALAFALRRLAPEPVTTVLITHDGAGPQLAPRQRQLELGPLDRQSAELLLSRQPHAPDAATRGRILGEAEGNPLALVELARSAAEHPRLVDETAGPLPLTDRLEQVYAHRLAALPEESRRAVIRLAAADVEDPPHPVLARLPGLDDPVWTPAERAGLLSRAGGRLRVGHALARLAIRRTAPAAERRAADLELAELFRAHAPDRSAWHLAAATTGPSARVAARLEASADRARRRSGYVAAARLLERSADLHPEPGERTRLLTAATGTAVLTGRPELVERLATRTRASTDDPQAVALAAFHVGQLMALTAAHSAAFAQLTRPARALAETAPGAAVRALAAAAVVRYYSGDPGQLRELDRLLTTAAAAPEERTALPTADAPPHAAPHDSAPPDDETAFLAAWARVVAHPEAAAVELPARLPDLIAAADRPQTLTLLAVAAWLLDETESAVRAFEAAFTAWSFSGPLPDGLGGVAALAYLDHGSWPRAQTACAELAAVAASFGLDHAAACAAATEAQVRALRGEVTGARAQAEHALSLIDPLESRSVLVLARRALGLAALAEGDHATAYLHLRALFDDEGHPTHYHLCYPALPELASAAARCDRHAEAATVVDAAERTLSGAGHLASRRAALVHLSRALLSPADLAEPHFTRALAAQDLAHRPFERANALLAYGEWLRRRRRIAAARPALVGAEATYRRLGAQPWTARAQAELRAAGAAGDPTGPSAFAALTPQQQQVVRLVAGGLTNREVAERLYLSPRTVSSHLYRAFPKLGVSARSQLRDILEAVDAAH